MLAVKDYKDSVILMVDDEPSNILLLEQMLLQEGYKNLNSTLDATQAAKMFAEIQPDLVLLDLNMPKMDGFDVMSQLKSLDPHSLVPILVLTALKDEKTRWRALRSGAKDFLCKPLDLIEANLRIKNLLEMRLLHQRVFMHNQILEDQVKVRTAELERTTKELSSFAYIASHDLQEPLRKIIVFGDRLAEKFESVLNDSGRDYINRMQKSALRMKNLIDDLLRFSRITTHSTPFQKVDLNEVLDEVLSDLEVLIERRKGKVEVGPLPVIDAEKFQMRQVFQNLISNSLKYHRDGVPPEVRISHNGSEKGLEKITIEDNGKGFDQKYSERIFMPFERLHGHSEYEGTGMGLAICQKILVHHNGSISATGRAGEGAVFSIYIPTSQRSE